MLYGRLPTSRTGPDPARPPDRRRARRPRSAQANRRSGDATPQPGRDRSRSHRGARTRCSSAEVAPPAGPISSSRSPSRGAIASTMRAMTERSARKCWPKRLRATCATMGADRKLRRKAPVASRATGRGIRRMRGRAPAAASPERLLDPALAQRLTRRLAHAFGRCAVGASLEHLDQVHAELGAHRVADLPGSSAAMARWNPARCRPDRPSRGHRRARHCRRWNTGAPVRRSRRRRALDRAVRAADTSPRLRVRVRSGGSGCAAPASGPPVRHQPDPVRRCDGRRASGCGTHWGCATAP